jgi:hypothetical protein
LIVTKGKIKFLIFDELGISGLLACIYENGTAKQVHIFFFLSLLKKTE